MRKTASNRTSEPVKRGRPALTPEANESYMINLAMKAAEQQLLDGTASSQVITHFLKLGTAKAQLELEKLKRENTLLEAKTDAIHSAEDSKELYENALNAMRSYSGFGEPGDPDDY